MRHWIIKNWRKSILWRHYSVAACCSRSWTSLWTTQHQSQRQTGYCVDCFPVANWAESIACLICWWHCWGAASWGSFLRTANGINPNRTNVKHKMENHNTFVDEWESLHSSPQHNACQNICPWISKDHGNKEEFLVHRVKNNNFLTCTWDKSSHLRHAPQYHFNFFGFLH